MSKKQTDYSDVCPNRHVYSTVATFMNDNLVRFTTCFSKGEFNIMCTALGIEADDAMDAMHVIIGEGKRSAIENDVKRPVVL
jgi:hypothetical protein